MAVVGALNEEKTGEHVVAYIIAKVGYDEGNFRTTKY